MYSTIKRFNKKVRYFIRANVISERYQIAGREVTASTATVNKKKIDGALIVMNIWI